MVKGMRDDLKFGSSFAKQREQREWEDSARGPSERIWGGKGKETEEGKATGLCGLVCGRRRVVFTLGDDDDGDNGSNDSHYYEETWMRINWF
jgi:hypothetical protein